MAEEKDQKELFVFEEPKKPFSKLANMLPKPDFEGRVAITLTLEKMVFISIGIVMLMVIVFALGVESGKSRRMPSQQPVPKKAVQPQAANQGARITAPIAAVQPSSPSQKSFFNMAPAVPNVKAAGQKTAATAAKGAAAQVNPKPYTIIAATFSKTETAQAAAAFLNKEGFSAYTAYSAPYYRVCVGAYADMYGAETQRDLTKVKRIYTDAFVKLR